MLLILQLSLIIAVLNAWLAFLRRPNELLSFYDRSLIGLDEKHPILHKILTCSHCHCGYMAIFVIIKAISITHFDFMYLLILPFSMVIYSIINALLNE